MNMKNQNGFNKLGVGAAMSLLRILKKTLLMTKVLNDCGEISWARDGWLFLKMFGNFVDLIISKVYIYEGFLTDCRKELCINVNCPSPQEKKCQSQLFMISSEWRKL